MRVPSPAHRTVPPFNIMERMAFGGCACWVLLHVLWISFVIHTLQVTMVTAQDCKFQCEGGSCVASKYVLCPNGCFHFLRKCPDGKCISTFLNCPDTTTPPPGTCPGHLKCEGGSCAKSQFQRCPNGCMPTKKKCSDGSCKYFCPKPTPPTTCPDNRRCQGGTCVDNMFETCPNGCRPAKKKCRDGSCNYLCLEDLFSTTTTTTPCLYRCPGGKCLSSRYLVCPNGCGPLAYKCPNGGCKGSAEECDCLSKLYCKEGVRCKDDAPTGCPYSTKDCPYNRQFECDSGRVCISTKLKCNGAKDCSDGSDEEDCEPENDSTIFYAILIPAAVVILIGVCCFCYRRSKSSSGGGEASYVPNTTHAATGTPMQPVVVGANPDTGNYNGRMVPPATTVPLLPPDGTAVPSAPPPAYSEAVYDERYQLPTKNTDTTLPSYDSVAHVEPSAPPQ